MLSHIFRRARARIQAGDAQTAAQCAPALLFFLENRVSGSQISNPDVREAFCRLDDTDLLFTLKQWAENDDPILADLSRRFVNRQFLRVHFLPASLTPDEQDEVERRIQQLLIDRNLTTADQAAHDASFYFASTTSSHFAYEGASDTIDVIDQAGVVREISAVADTQAIVALTRFVQKPYICIPKALKLDFLQYEDSRSH